MRCERIAVRAAAFLVELRAVFAREAKVEALGFGAEASVDDGLHFVLVRSATVSTWAVSGNISNVSIESSV